MSPYFSHDDIDYLPFGEVSTNYGTVSDIHYKFTGDESDDESSTDYAVYRNLSGRMARFNRPDPYDGSYDQTNPQSFNRYAYVNNSPLMSVDPLGLQQIVITTTTCYEDQRLQCIKQTYVINVPDSVPISISPMGVLMFGSSGAGGGGPKPAPVTINHAPNKKQQQDCLNQYNNSTAGKTVQFLSLYNLATNLGSLKTWAEWTALPALKIGAVALLNKASQAIGNTEFWSITSGATTPTATVLSPTAAGIGASESVGAIAAPIAIGAATVLDIRVHAACAGLTPPDDVYVPTIY